MLSRLLQPLRNILPVNILANPVGPETEIPPAASTMVTTRHQTENKAALGQDVDADAPSIDEIPAELLSPNSRKRRRTQGAGDTKVRGSRRGTSLSSDTKRQRLPARNKGDEVLEKHSNFSVVIPVRNIVEVTTAKSIPSNQTNTTVNPAIKQEPEETIEQNEDSIVATRESGGNKPKKSADEVVKDTMAITPLSKGSKRSRQVRETAIGSKMDAEPNMERSQGGISNSAPKRKHKRFGSEEPASEEIIEDTRHVEEAEESSDDDAPEVVATHDAEESIKIAAREASKAAEKQEAAIRKKRRERDAQLKEQAAAASKKRKLSENVEDALNVGSEHSDLEKTTKSRDKAEKSPDHHTTKQGENISHSELRKKNAPLSQDQAPRKSKYTIDKSNIPEFLPAEYLEDSMDIDEAPIQAQTGIYKKTKKIVFTDLVKRPKDLTKGSTTYRISDARGITTGVLAPPAAQNARSTKEAWMQGRGNGRDGFGATANRKAVNTGFFVKR